MGLLTAKAVEPNAANLHSVGMSIGNGPISGVALHYLLDIPYSPDGMSGFGIVYFRHWDLTAARHNCVACSIYVDQLVAIA